ncbi:ABC transporter permease [Modestobacter sp. VKM Ac-2979]|uniref:ABC transporter permease n=1 Tax=unclassified Modestobacter TaxID=2643866 RepID=UPI0022AB9E91|nr:MULTISPECIES: ABC transporter permease [unclassified Modestobacter]MCZ2809823.1 ABC transporter permease [Modestobacter sp. VKM Ac-2979]MCZ2842762.1 ABC transporter permease [Modestobacter sp. VKM Ac-2980]
MTDLLLFQLRRVGRNKQYLFFTVLLPALFTIFFTKVIGGQAPAGEYQDLAGAVLVSMMAYGAIGAALGATIRIAFDRSSGWLRQLRVTPVPTGSVFAVDVVVGALLVLPSLLVVALVGRFVNGVEFGLGTWLALVGSLWAGSVVFVALGLAVGLALDAQAAGAAIGILGTVLAALGGLWFPVEMFPDGMAALARAMPSYWFAELGRDITAGTFTGPPVMVLAGYGVVFAAAALVVARRRPLHAVAG